MPRLRQRIENAEVVQARQHLADRHHGLTPDLLNHLVVLHESLAFSAARHADQLATALLQPRGWQPGWAGFFHLRRAQAQVF